MVIGPVLLACLAGGWIGASGLRSEGAGRVLLTLPLGAGMWLASTFLLGLALAPIAAWICAAALTVLSGFLLARGQVATSRVTLSWSSWLLFLLAGLAAWLSTVGGCQLAPPRQFLLFDLPRTAQLAAQSSPERHPLGSEAMSGVTPFALAAAIAGDPLAGSLVLGGLAQVATVLAWLLLLSRLNPTAPLAVLLGGLALFMGTPDGWIVSSLPSDGATHLLAVLALWGWTQRGVKPALVCLVALATLSPQLALALALAIVIDPPRHPAVLLCGLAIGGALGGPPLALLAAGWIFWTHPKRWVRALAVAGFLSPGVFGLAAFGVVLGRFARVLWLGYGGEHWGISWSPRMALAIPRRVPLAIFCALALWVSLAPGEEVFNDRVLIFAQKQHVKIEELLRPRRLSDWALWRGASVGLDPADLQAAEALRDLQGPVVYLSGQPEERVEVAALVSALAGGRPLDGWYAGLDGAGQLPAVAAVASTGRDELLGTTPARWLVRRGRAPQAVPPLAEVLDRRAGRPTRSQRWGTLHWFETDGPARFRVLRNGRPFGPDYGVSTLAAGSIPFQLPDLPGVYKVEWGSDSHETYRFPASLPIEVTLRTPATVPSRSLLPLVVTLSNTSAVALDLSDLVSARLALYSLTGRPDKPEPWFGQSPLELGPRQSRDLQVYLRTPAEPDFLRAELELQDARGNVHVLGPVKPPVLRCWNRRPSLTVPDGVVRR